MVFSSRLLNKETKSIIEKKSKADGNHTIAANVAFHTTEFMLSKHNIAYLSSLYSKLQQLDDIKEQNPTEKRINYLRRKKYNHMVLYHDGKHNKSLNICDNSSKIQRMHLPPEEKTDFGHFMKTHRIVFGVQQNKSLFIGLAWEVPIEKKTISSLP